MNAEKKFIDCTLPITPDMVRWPGDELFERRVDTTFDRDGVETSTLTMSSHAGTHIDAPRHFLPEHAGGIDTIPLTTLIGPAIVVHIPDDINCIELEHCRDINFDAAPRIVFRTFNSTRRLLEHTIFSQDYVSLSESTATFLVENGVRLVGIDYLSVEKKGNPGHPVHTILLGAGVIILEGVVLADVPAGMYTLTALPLRIVGGDGAPCRVILSPIFS